MTLAESTPVHEAARLQVDLRRPGIEPFGRLINASFAQTATANPTLAARATGERRLLAQINELSAARTRSVPWQQEPPVGTNALRELARQTHAAR